MPPVEIGDAIEALLAAGGERVAIGDRTIEFWWVKSLPLRTGTTESTWKSVDEGALVGAVKLSSVFSDVRGTPIKPGTYTLRYAVQPAGNRTARVAAAPADRRGHVGGCSRAR